MEWAALVRATAALVLLTAAAAKLRRPAGFVQALRGYGVIPAAAAPVAAAAVIAAEAATGALLVLGVASRPGTIAAASLFALFAVVAGAALLRTKTDTDCGCLGGALRLELDWVLVGANLLLAIALAVAASQPVLVSVTTSARSTGATAAIVVWSAGLLFAAIYWLVSYARTVSRLIARVL